MATKVECFAPRHALAAELVRGARNRESEALLQLSSAREPRVRTTDQNGFYVLDEIEPSEH